MGGVKRRGEQIGSLGRETGKSLMGSWAGFGSLDLVRTDEAKDPTETGSTNRSSSVCGDQGISRKQKHKNVSYSGDNKS